MTILSLVAIAAPFYDCEQTFGSCASGRNLKVGIPAIFVGMKAKVSEKGQVTVPKKLRESLDIRPGDELEFIEEGGRLIALKVASLDPVASVYGSIDLGRSTDELLRDLRGDLDLP
jgi:AbrB family looped-hinge helix DNA binding protein